MFTNVSSAVINGNTATVIDVEVDSSNGKFAYNFVGLADLVVKEARERTRLAMKNTGYVLPSKCITVNFVPADIKKAGSYMDLAIAIGVIKIIEEKESYQKIGYIGELGLAGQVIGINGIIPILISLQEEGIKRVVIPDENFEQAKLLKGIEVLPVSHLSEAVDTVLNPDNINWQICLGKFESNIDDIVDFSEVSGQYEAKRALEISASGGHNVLMMGSPGSGKSMLSKRLSTIMPKLSYQEVLELTKIYSLSHISLKSSIVKTRPFRSPHHSSSVVSICGGGSNISPGEITLANRGVLFLDEFPEFSRNVLESIRQPLEDKHILISRASGKILYPAFFTLIAAFNPCPCGYQNDEDRVCTCNYGEIKRYQNKISGPILDRFDIQIILHKVTYENLRKKPSEESSESIRKRVELSRDVQKKRFSDDTTLNAHMNNFQIRKYCKIDDETESMLESAYQKMNLSARSLNNVLKLSRTIADMEEKEKIKIEHVLEALSYRQIDEKWCENEAY